MQDVAERAGVSRSLVSLVMRDSPKVSDEKRARVLAAAAELGYRPNVLARHLAEGSTRTIGVIINDLHNTFFAEAADGIEAEARANGYRLILASGSLSEDREIEAMEQFLELRTDGIILLGPWASTSLIEVRSHATPTVVVARTVRSDVVDSVINNDRLGAALAVRHLHALGHHRIAHIGGGRGAGARPRRTSYERAMRSLGLHDHIQVETGDYTEASATKAMGKLLDAASRPTAVFAGNDLMAAGAMDRIEVDGLTVPDDISVIGYDNTALAALNHMSLSTINQPRFEMGQLAMKLILERIDGGRTTPVHHVLDPTLVVRRTTGPVPS